MTTALLKYDAACRAIAEASTIDEVKDIRDKAEAMRLYARQAKNTGLEEKAAVIRLRGERRLGEMLIDAKEAGKLRPGQPRKKNGSETEPIERIRLEDYGIDKKLSSESQRLAGLTDDNFEALELRVTESIRDRNVRSTSTLEKQQQREGRERILGACQMALPNRKYGVIVADPPWRFEPYSRDSGMDRAADNHYPTSDVERIAQSHDVPSIAASDCVLFLWATVPMLTDAIWLINRWGFSYRSNYVWQKDRIGTGYWNRNAHEHLLIGVKGNIPAPAPGTQRSSVIIAPVANHSAKPECVLEMIEQYFPTLPKIELNRRGPARSGWDSWGNEAEQTLEHDASAPPGPASSEPAASPTGEPDAAGSHFEPGLDDLKPGQWAERPPGGDWIIRTAIA